MNKVRREVKALARSRKERNRGQAVDWEIPQISNRLVHHALQASPMSSIPVGSPITSMARDCWPVFDDFVRQMSRPFDHPPAKCPLSYNEAPTFRTNVGRTTVTISNRLVPATTTYTLNLMPGWNDAQSAEYSLTNPPPAGYSFLKEVTVTPTANICTPFVDGAGNEFVPAPVNLTNTYNGAPIASACVTGGFARNSGGVAIQGYWNFVNREAWEWDVAMPFTGLTADPSSFRWRCTGISVRFANTTPGADRGGNVWSVQPTYGVTDFSNFNASVPLGSMAREPSCREWGVCSKPVTLSAILKPKDLAYWSCYAPSNDATGGHRGTLNVQNPAMCIAFDAGAKDQTYNIQVEYHWEYAGNYMQTLLSEGSHLPEAKNAFEPASAHVINTAPSADHLPALTKVMEHVNSGRVAEVMSHPVVKSAMKSAAGSGLVTGLLEKVGAMLPRAAGAAAVSAVSGLLGH